MHPAGHATASRAVSSFGPDHRVKTNTAVNPLDPLHRHTVQVRQQFTKNLTPKYNDPSASIDHASWARTGQCPRHDGFEWPRGVGYWWVAAWVVTDLFGPTFELGQSIVLTRLFGPTWRRFAIGWDLPCRTCDLDSLRVPGTWRSF
ncbi:hypothetical protein Lfu02_77320 [Longispora fulva]|nr:hypothetical protein Lfu02_77320 [Longispora fulva]